MKWSRQFTHRVLGGIAASFLFFVFLRWFERANVYQPTRRHDLVPSALGLEFREVLMRTSDGVEIHGWFFPAKKTNAPSPTAVLIAHGNGGNISHRFPLYQLLLEAGLNVMAFDYRGYGSSKGSPSEGGTYLDAIAARQWLLDQGFAPDRIVLLGESLGGGIVSEIAVREPVGALILLSTFTSIPDLGAELFPFLPVRTVSSIRYDTVAKLAKVRAPVLILHSRQDGLIPYSHAQRNFAAAKEPKFLSEIQGSHNESIEEDKDRIQTLIWEFLAQRGLAAAMGVSR